MDLGNLNVRLYEAVPGEIASWEDAETSTAARGVGRGNLPNATVDKCQL